MSKGNFKSFTLLAFIMLIGVRAMAQDVIVLKNGDEIKSLVQEIGTEYVKYKKFDNQTGPVYNVPISKIFMIKYENGTKDVFNEVTQSPETKAEQAVKLSQVEEKQEPRRQEKVANLSAVGGKVFLDGQAIKYKQVCDILTLNDSLTNANANYLYMSGYSQLKFSKSSFWLGTTLGVAGVGIMLFAAANAKGTSEGTSYPSYLSVGYVCAGVGIVSLIISIPYKISGSNRITDAINIYNTSIQPKHKTDLSMNFGVTQSGRIGFTLNF